MLNPIPCARIRIPFLIVVQNYTNPESGLDLRLDQCAGLARQTFAIQELCLLFKAAFPHVITPALMLR